MTADHRDARYDRGVTLRSAGRADLAAAEFEAALALDPRHARSYAMLALCRVDLGDARAEDASLRALELGAADAFVHYARGWVLLDVKRTKDALFHAKEALRISSGVAEHFVLLAEIRFRVGEHGAALADADEALRIEPRSVRAHRQRALALRGLDRLDEAREAAETALALAPDAAESHRALGRVAAAQRDAATAAREYREALRLNPGDAAAREGLLHAMKIRHPAYRWATALHVAFRRIPPWVRIALVLVAALSLGRAATSGIAVVVVVAALADAFANLVLRFDRHGRHLLNPLQVLSADMLAGLLLGAAGVGAALLVGAPPAAAWTAAFAGLHLPTALRPWNCRPGAAKWMAAFAGPIVVAGLACPWAVDYALHATKASRVPDDAALVGVCGVFGGVVSVLGFAFGGVVARRCGWPWTHRFNAPPPRRGR